MKTQQILFLLLILSFTVLTQPGCAIGAIAAGVGAAKAGSAKQREAYGKYRTEMEKLNTEREKSGLATRPILTYREWAKGEK